MNIRQQQGQAMAEFLTVVGVFITLLFAIPFLGKLGEIRQNMEEAARHAAWERTVWLGATQKADKGAVVLDDQHLQENVVHHFFTGKVERAEMAETNMVPESNYWHTMKGAPLINKVADISVSTTDGDTPGAVFQHVLAPVLNIFTLLGTDVNAANGNGAIFAIDTKGLYRADVSAQVNNELGGTLNFKSNVTLLANEWYGGGKGRTAKKVQGMVATAAMNSQGMQDFIKVTNQIDKVLNLGGIGPTAAFGLQFGKATDDGLPDDRKELIKKWEMPKYGDAPAISAPYNEYRKYQYIPSAAAVAQMPLTGGVIDPSNTLQSLP